MLFALTRLYELWLEALKRRSAPMPNRKALLPADIQLFRCSGAFLQHGCYEVDIDSPNGLHHPACIDIDKEARNSSFHSLV